MSAPAVSVDTPATHWERKTRELAYVQTFAGEHAGPATPVHGFAGYFAAVQAARRGLRIQQAERSAHLFETALVGPDVPRFDIGPTSIAYNYQRYNLARVDIDWLATLHGRQAPGTPSVAGSWGPAWPACRRGAGRHGPHPRLDEPPAPSGSCPRTAAPGAPGAPPR